jgi:hemerythrin-like domain-containing protein
MYPPVQTRSRPGLTSIDPGLLAAPIDYLHAVHLREREVCAMLDRIADLGRASGTETKPIMSFLSDELPLHLEDEETDLFPLLQARCSEEDEIDRLLKRLSTDHRHADFDTPRITAILQGATPEIEPTACAALHRYADHARRHLILENAILLPFARLRLNAGDLSRLHAGTARRRGIANDVKSEPKRGLRNDDT